MKKTAFALLLAATACSNPAQHKLQGTWRAKNGSEKLEITKKTFASDEEALAEDYFLKGDTIFTSFKGNQPYTRYVIQKLDDHYLKLLGPDSIAMEYSR